MDSDINDINDININPQTKPDGDAQSYRSGKHHAPRSRQSQRRAARWRESGGRENMERKSQEAVRTKQKQMQYSSKVALLFYNATLRDDPAMRRKCTDRSILNEIIKLWKENEHLEGRPMEVSVAPSNLIGCLKNAKLIDTWTSKKITWAEDEDKRAENVAMSFYNTKLRGNPTLRRSCSDRSVLNDTVDLWKIEERLEGRRVINVPPARIIFSLMKWELIDPNSNISRNIIWVEESVNNNGEDEVEGVDNEHHFNKKQQHANRAALSFYNSKLRDNPTLRWSCSHRQVLNVTIDQWKTERMNYGDPPRKFSRSSIIYGLIKKRGLIESTSEDVIFWKEDVDIFPSEDDVPSFDDMLLASLDLND